MGPPTQNTEKEERECWGGWEEGGGGITYMLEKKKNNYIYMYIYKYCI